MSEEVPLSGGRVTPGVTRVADTVRRPSNPNSPLVRELLRQLEQAGFDAAPRYLGQDEQGREIFSFQPGEVPTDSTRRSRTRVSSPPRDWFVATTMRPQAPPSPRRPRSSATTTSRRAT